MSMCQAEKENPRQPILRILFQVGPGDCVFRIGDHATHLHLLNLGRLQVEADHDVHLFIVGFLFFFELNCPATILRVRNTHP